METQLVIAGQPIRSRFFLGTGKFPSYQIMKEAIIASSAHIVTVALRRIDPQAKEDHPPFRQRLGSFDIFRYTINPAPGHSAVISTLRIAL